MRDHFTLDRPETTAGRAANLIDVTLRDGGFEVDFAWPAHMFSRVAAVAGACGVDVVELGYIGGVPAEHGAPYAGAAAHLTIGHVAQARASSALLAAMIHPTALSRPLDLQPCAAAGLNMVRLVYHPDWFADIAQLAAAASRVGLTVSVNIAMASRYEPGELADHAARISDKISPDVLYIADTCGGMAPEEVADRIGRIKKVTGAQIGFHAHDPLSLAYANSLAAAGAGATFLDCSLLGLGRGGGNLSGELMLVRHRLLGAGRLADVDALLALRGELSVVSGWPVLPLLARVCGALNLTPVEEQALRAFADTAGLDLDRAAMWLATVAGSVDSYRADDLLECWRSAEQP
ncbi:hypothetical protein [Catellatospora sichuanensis]|uniref:hypothetical protein n=1 Tax=Catellatospora sichuanensis TaxID=1969805 RepID=UPI00118404D8|nr:hypothetical protein [Catellatospora sichuanensis]